MYTPGFNQVADRAILLDAMRASPFAILFGPPSSPQAQTPPVATHLPLIIKDEGAHGLLEGHFALANPHWRSLAGRETLAVFSGPHAYVSPFLYAEPVSVPTWNYIAIHAHGTLTLVEGEEEKLALLHSLIQQYEPAYEEKLRSLPGAFRRSMLAGIVGFRIPISRIEGKFKLSQNRSAIDRRQVQAAHAAGDSDQQALAAWMVRLGLGDED